MVKILYFGKLGDMLGTVSESLTLPDGIEDTEMLREFLDASRRLEGALMNKSVRISVNSELVNAPISISNNDEIAFMPPVGGG